MKTVKVMSIIGLVMAVLTLICLLAFDNSYSYESAIGWGIILVFWTIAQSIVGIVQSKQR
jgi:hypothetical protein